MRRIFEPLTWVVNKISGDYGIDFDVQIFEQHKATGEWFKVQLKSSGSTAYSAQGDFISETLDTEHAKHYSTEIRDPVLLIHADVTNGQTFWHAPQFDAAIDKDDSRESITVRIDTRNELPATLPELISTLRRIRIKLGARAVSESPVSDFSQSVADDRKQEELIKNFQDKLDSLKLRNIRELANAGKREDAKNKAEILIHSGETSIETKLSAVLEEERAELMTTHESAAPQSTMSQIRWRTGTRLYQLTKKGPPPLKFFALMVKKAAELELLTFRDFGLHMNLLGHIQEGDPTIITPSLAIEQLQSTNRIVAKYNQCVRLARYAANSPHRWALPIALLRVVESISIFIIRLRIEGQGEAARQYRASAMRLCHLAVWIAEKNKDDESLSYASTNVLLLAGKGDDEKDRNETISFAREIVAAIKNQHIKEITQNAFDRAIRRMSGERVEGDRDPDLVTQIVENRAWGIGIDMTDSENFLVKAIRLGIKDANPERAIRHCEHAFISISGRGVPLFITTLAQILQHSSILSKIVHCDLYDYAIEGRTLDSACGEFKKKYCDVCKDISPRPTNWKYSDEWQQEENQKHVEFMTKFYQKRYGSQGSG